jgi:hypothetical protein
LATAADQYLTNQFDDATLATLFADPEGEVQGLFDGIPYTARIAIPHYGERISSFYKGILPNGLRAACIGARIPFDLPHFGLVVTFADAAEIALHDADLQLNEKVRALVGRYGPVIFRNAHIERDVRKMFHRNIFPHLRFHVDRGPSMPNQFSCFTRDPFDAEQRHPRTSSTLFIANIVSWLELVRSGGCKPGEETGVRPSTNLFERTAMAPLFGEIILEQPWSEPEGTGEIAVIDNRTMLHATYHKDGMTGGYRIGARYLV